MTECGADWTLNVRELPVKETRKKVRALAEEAGAGQTEWRIFETSGTPAGQELAWALLTWGAYLGVVGYSPADGTVRPSNLMAGRAGRSPALGPQGLRRARGGTVGLTARDCPGRARPSVERAGGRRPLHRVSSQEPDQRGSGTPV